MSHFIEHLLFKGSRTHSAQEIAEIFDGLGGELNAATSRETTVVYARVPDDRVEQALDVIVGMVYEPVFAEVDSEREVVLEEIAMVEDNPQDLVHDVVAEAVFGGHSVGRPVIGRAEVISSVGRRALASFHRDAYAADNIVVAAAGNVEHDRLAKLARRAAARDAAVEHAPAQAGRPPAGRTAPLPAQGDRAVPRLPRGARPFAARRATLRRLAPRRDPRRLRLVASLPGDPREARDGVRRLQLRLAVLRYGPDRALRRHARGEPRPSASRSRRTSWPTWPRGTCAQGELERAKENLKGRMLLSLESTSNRMSRLGKSLLTDTELLSLEELVERIDAVSADDVAALAAELLRPERFSAAGIGPSGRRFRAAVERVNPALVARAAA